MFCKLEDDLMRKGLEQFWSLFISGNADVKLCLMLGLSMMFSSYVILYYQYLMYIVNCFFKRAWHARSTILNNYVILITILLCNICI